MKGLASLSDLSRRTSEPGLPLKRNPRVFLTSLADPMSPSYLLKCTSMEEPVSLFYLYTGNSELYYLQRASCKPVLPVEKDPMSETVLFISRN
jgi:hypothetical protein